MSNPSDSNLFRFTVVLSLCTLNLYVEAKRRADVWNSDDGKQVRSSDLARKHREVQREEDLRNLRVFVEKLVLGQLNVVFCANTRRWKKSCNLFASKHLMALEKVLGSWKSLANKILKTKGDTDAMTKAVVVETMDTPTSNTAEDTKEDEKADELVVETIGNDAPPEYEAVSQVDQEKAAELERERKEQEEKERKAREEEAERVRIEKEKEEQERREREAEAARIKKEKEEELKKEQEANKAKMKEMFQDDEDKPDSEFPWEDDQ